MIYHVGREKYDNSNVNIKINNSSTAQVTKVKFLGVWMDEQLNWKVHITYISNKISKVIGILKKIRQYVGYKILVNLYYALIFAYFTYCVYVGI